MPEPTPPAEPQAPPAAPRTMAEDAMAITQRGLDEKAADAVPDAGSPDWWEALGEEGQKLREGKKWEKPDDLLKAYKEATTRLSRRDEERAELEEKVARMEASQRQPQQQQAPDQNGSPPALDFDALAAQCIDPQTGEMNFGQMMSLAVGLGARMAYDASDQRLNERLTQFEQERVSPLAQRDQEARLAAELDQIEEMYGSETFDRLMERVEAERERDATFLDRFGGARGAFAEMAFRTQQEQLREQDAFTTRGTSRRPQERQLTQAERELEAMNAYRRRRDDGF